MAGDACPALSTSTLVFIVRPLEFAATAAPVVSSPAANVRLYDPAARVAPEVVQTTRSTAADITHDTVGILPDPFSCPAGCSLPEKKFAGSATVTEFPGNISLRVLKEKTVADVVVFNANRSNAAILMLTECT